MTRFCGMMVGTCAVSSSQSRSATSSCPRKAARSKAASPSRFALSLSAPASQSRVATSRCRL
eukprot:14112374-Heterocapsa_arctica.AAC.1